MVGLARPVRVITDRNGLPHIFAPDMASAYVALGYLHARDRLFQMEFMRRLAAGRLSELVGTLVGPFALRADIFMRSLGLARAAAESLPLLSEQTRLALDGYTAGVNAWLKNRTGPLPLEFQLLAFEPEVWRPADSLAWGKLMAVQLSGNFRAELQRAKLLDRLDLERVEDLIGKDNPADSATMPPPFADFGFLQDLIGRSLTALPRREGPATASNGWVLNAEQTTTGGPILVNDPHLRLQAPVLWYLARIETPELSLRGATVPGVPMHVIGTNGDIAWGFTTTHADTQDVFIERLHPTDQDRYLTPSGYVPMTIRTETIPVRWADDVTIRLRATRHGPVISDFEDQRGHTVTTEGHVLALAAATLSQPDTSGDALMGINRATSWDTFQAALRSYRAPVQNLVFASRNDAIGALTVGAVPIRKAGDGRFPVPGWTGEHDWVGTIPFEAMPRLTNPPSGYLATANNRVVGPDYPYLLTADWPDAYRARRIHNRLATGESRSIEAAGSLLRDAVNLAARDLLPIMLTRVQADNPQMAQALSLLADWDGTMGRGLPEPLIFETWLRTLHAILFAGPLGDDYPPGWMLDPRVIHHVLTNAAHRWCSPGTDPAVSQPCAREVATSLSEALEALAEAFGDDIDQWRWGNAHRAPLAHMFLGRIPFIGSSFSANLETDGSSTTVNRGGFGFGGGVVRFDHMHGATLRAVFDLNDPSKSQFMIATGSSGNPLSPYFLNLSEAWRDGEMLTLAGTEAQLTETAIGILDLLPADANR